MKKMIAIAKNYLGRNKLALETAAPEDLRAYSRALSDRGMNILKGQGIGIAVYGMGTLMMLGGLSAVTLPVMSIGLVLWGGAIALNAINRSEQNRVWKVEMQMLTKRLEDNLLHTGPSSLASASLSGFDKAAKPAAPEAERAKPQTPKPPQI